MNSSAPGAATVEKHPGNFAYLLDLALYLTVMFAIREVYFDEFSFLANGIFWSVTALLVASWRIKARGLSWAALGLRRPKNLPNTVLATGAILALGLLFVIVFNMALSQFGWGLAADTSAKTTKFGALESNWVLLLGILPVVWLESAFEELLDRGFLINWFERLFSSSRFATVVAVLLQAAIFGFRHSYDLSERSITVGLIGLAMGIGYVVFGRNLWPLILAHCAFNTISMLERVG